MGDSTSLHKGGQPDGNRPGPSNTGSSEKIPVVSIDWITYVVPSKVDLAWCTPEHPAYEFYGEAIRPFKGYTSARKMDVGRVDYTDSLERGKRVTFTGSEVQSLREAGADLAELISYALYEVEGHFTRLDVAIDLFPAASVRIMDLLDEFRAGKVTTPAKYAYPAAKFNKQGGDEGVTVYIGTRESGRMLRVYDKAARNGVPGPWIRIELETHDEWADVLAKAILINDLAPAAQLAIRDFVTSDLPWFADAVTGPVAFMDSPQPKLTDRQRHYRENVLPMIASDLLKDDSGWLRMALQGLLDDTETDAHGPVGAIKNSTKLTKGLKILTGLAAAYEGGLCKLAFALNGKQAVYDECERLGYRWDTKAQTWVR